MERSCPSATTHESRSLLMTNLERSPAKPRSAKLFRRSYLLFLVALYTCLSVFAWTIVCVQTNRPITTHSYGYINATDYLPDERTGKMKQNQDWFRVVNVLLAITNTLVLPLTSTICASAAVIYVQNFGRQRNFSMLHTSTLADKGWMSPQIWLVLLTKNGWNSRGSLFLLFAMALHVLGFIIGPLQQYYMIHEVFKLQTLPRVGFQSGPNIFSLFELDSDGLMQPQQTSRLRSKLASVSEYDFQSSLWQEGTPQCNSSSHYNFIPECFGGGGTFKNLTTLLNPYFVQLPSGINTGLLTQYIPRINSSVQYSNVSVDEFPPNCKDKGDAYYIEYAASESNGNIFRIQVCMPDDQSKSPWQETQDRQDISESLFLNITFGDPDTLDWNPENATFKISANTTLGYFELPNYRNKLKSGPLLTKDPYNQSTEPGLISPYTLRRSLQVNESDGGSLHINESDGGFEFHKVGNKGPLAMLTAALFEPGSFIATQIPTNITDPFDPDSTKQAALPCTIPPLALLLSDHSPTYRCIEGPFDISTGFSYLSDWIGSFYYGIDMQNALHAAVILACQVWLTTGQGNTTVWYDMGQDFVRPKISATGLIVISILLAADLFLLLALALYICLSYTWTSSFDPLIMMRLGATRADELPLMINSPAEEKKMRSVLENMPGWVGDGKPDDEDAGVLALGASAPLRSGRHYLVG